MKLNFIREQILIFAESVGTDDLHGEFLLGFAVLDKPNLTVPSLTDLADG